MWTRHGYITQGFLRNSLASVLWPHLNARKVEPFSLPLPPGRRSQWLWSANRLCQRAERGLKVSMVADPGMWNLFYSWLSDSQWFPLAKDWEHEVGDNSFAAKYNQGRASLVAQTLKNLPQCERLGFIPWVWKIPWRRASQHTPVFLPGESSRTIAHWASLSMGSQRVRTDWANTHSHTHIIKEILYRIYQFSSVAQSCPTLCNSMNCSTPGLPVRYHLPEPTQTHVHGVGDAIQPSHSLSSPSPPALNLSQNQGLLKWVSSLHQVAKVLEFQLQHQSFQWTPWNDLL